MSWLYLRLVSDFIHHRSPLSLRLSAGGCAIRGLLLVLLIFSPPPPPQKKYDGFS